MENVIRILVKELNREQANLKIFVDSSESNDIYSKKFGLGNIPSCQSRINELEKTIGFLKSISTIKSQKRISDLPLTFEDNTFMI